MEKNIIAVLFAVLLIGGSLYAVNINKEEIGSDDKKEEESISEETNGSEETSTPEEEIKDEDLATLVDCLKEKEVVIYGSKTCPHCSNLVDSFGGYEIVGPIYVECSEEAEKCSSEKNTGYVPEVQISKEIYEGGRSPASLADKVGCEI